MKLPYLNPVATYLWRHAWGVNLGWRSMQTFHSAPLALEQKTKVTVQNKGEFIIFIAIIYSVEWKFL
jgi:hypothetical protein